MQTRCLLGRRVGEQLDLVELVDPQQATGVLAGGTGLAAEAAGVRAEAHRQRVLGDDLVATQRGEGHLGGGDRPQLVTFDLVRLVGELRQVPGRDHGVGADEGRRPDLFVQIDVAVDRQLAQRPDQRRPRTSVHDEHGPRHLHRTFDVEDSQRLGGLPVLDALVIARSSRGRSTPRGPRRCRPRPRRRGTPAPAGSGSAAGGRAAPRPAPRRAGRAPSPRRRASGSAPGARPRRPCAVRGRACRPRSRSPGSRPAASPAWPRGHAAPRPAPRPRR